ncbi:MAG TPA: polyketide synthase dehydratase domain-containing protein, partial [Myxococcaceae bacterium]|nr:polyketide synthase dehydratase domain-containing protein [Myxococcaceae bacterium]
GCVARLYVLGLAPDRKRFTEGLPRPERALPTYPFQRKPYWLRPPRESGQPSTGGVFDGTPLSSPRREREFSYRLSRARLPDLADNHGICHIGHYQELIARAARQHLGLDAYTLRDVRYLVALHVGPTEEKEVRLVVEPAEGDTMKLSVHGLDRERSRWHQHLEAVLERAEPKTETTRALPGLEGATVWDGRTFYARLSELSFELGESVKWVEEVRFREGEAVARFRPDTSEPEARAGLGFHAGILDACAQLFAVAGASHLEGRMRFMVVGWERFQLHRPPRDGTLWCHIAFPEPRERTGCSPGASAWWMARARWWPRPGATASVG